MGKCLVYSLWLARTTSPSNPTSPVTWYQRERHSSAGKAIPCSPPVFCTSLSFDSFIPPSIIPLLPHFLVLSFLPSSSLALPLHCSPPCPTNMAVFGFVGRGWSWGGEGWDYRHGDPHKNSPVSDGRECVHTFPVPLLQLQQEELEVWCEYKGWVMSRSKATRAKVTSRKHYRKLRFYKPPLTTAIVL